MSKVIVRHQLWVDGPAGLLPAGSRLFDGGAWPHQCVKDGEKLFVFDDPAKAKDAAAALEKYVNRERPKRKTK